MHKLKCDWCHSDNIKDTGGTEYTGMPIVVCECGHEWVDSKRITDKEKHDRYVTLFKDLFK